MRTAMDSIKQMVDVNTVVGTPVEAQDGSVIIPVSRVTFGFAAGGGDFEDQRPRRSLNGWGRRRGYDRGQEPDGEQDGGDRGGSPFPFAGGSGAGVSVQPVGFLVMTDGDVRLINVDGMPVLERLVELAPVLLDQVTTLLQPGGHGEPGSPEAGQEAASSGGEEHGGGQPPARRFRRAGPGADEHKGGH